MFVKMTQSIERIPTFDVNYPRLFFADLRSRRDRSFAWSSPLLASTANYGLRNLDNASWHRDRIWWSIFTFPSWYSCFLDNSSILTTNSWTMLLYSFNFSTIRLRVAVFFGWAFFTLSSTLLTLRNLQRIRFEICASLTYRQWNERC